jgi:hypothetical protein
VAGKPAVVGFSGCCHDASAIHCHSTSNGGHIECNGCEQRWHSISRQRYRWQIQEDATHRVVPNNPATNFATDFHRSYMPLVASGDHTSDFPNLDPSKHYFVSVIPNELGAYSIGGAPLAGTVV